jgi:hypothetical protein
MNRTPIRRLLTTAVAAAAATTAVAAASPAAAADLFFAKSSGLYASATWLEVGELPAATGVGGNAHIGDIWVEDLGKGRASVFGTVFDLQCEAGVTPYIPGGGHGEVPAPGQEPEGCVLVSLRFIDGGDLTFTIDKKLNQATLTGTLAVGSGHGEPTAAPPVDITWIGTGPTSTTRQSSTFTDQSGTFTFRYTSTDRQAQVAAGSRIGPMIFDDEPGEASSAVIGSYRSVDRGRS